MSETCPKCREPLVDRPPVGGFNTSGRYERYQCGTLTGAGGYLAESPACFRRQLAERDAENKRLRAALRMVEWVQDPHDASGDSNVCAWCDADEEDGHIPDCIVAAALKTEAPA